MNKRKKIAEKALNVSFICIKMLQIKQLNAIVQLLKPFLTFETYNIVSCKAFTRNPNFCSADHNYVWYEELFLTKIGIGSSTERTVSITSLGANCNP